MLADQPTYTIRELFLNLDIPLTQFAKESKVDSVTLARIRDGEPAYSSTVNKVLNHFSIVYKRRLGMDNVTNVNIQVSRKPRKKD